VKLSPEIYAEMVAHALRSYPLEACGVLGGKEGKPLRFYPADNELEAEDRYRVPPAQLLAIFRELDREKLDLLAIFHSHPRGRAWPSETDVREAHYPCLYLILSLSSLDPSSPLPPGLWPGRGIFACFLPDERRFSLLLRGFWIEKGKDGGEELLSVTIREEPLVL